MFMLGRGAAVVFALLWVGYFFVRFGKDLAEFRRPRHGVDRLVIAFLWLATAGVVVFLVRFVRNWVEAVF